MFQILQVFVSPRQSNNVGAACEPCHHNSPALPSTISYSSFMANRSTCPRHFVIQRISHLLLWSVHLVFPVSTGMILVQRALAAHARLSCCRYYSSTSVGSVVSRNKEPLRILFCGSDEFSIASLEPLVDIKTRDSSLIESINVLCRPDKRVGSGLKRLNEGKI